MSIAFDTGAEQLSSSASSSFISEEPMSDPRLGVPTGVGAAATATTAGAARSPEPMRNTPIFTTGGPGGPNSLNVNKVSGARGAGAAVGEKLHISSPNSRTAAGAARFVDPKDENWHATYARTATGASTATAASVPPHTSPLRAHNAASQNGSASTNNGAAAARVGATATAGASKDEAAHTAVEDFAKDISEAYFKCAVCNKVAVDAVMLEAKPVLACRRCSLRLSSSPPVELPKALVDAMQAVKAASGMPEREDDIIAERRRVRAKRFGEAANGKAGSGTVNGLGDSPASVAATAIVAVLAEVMDAEAAERQQITMAESLGRADVTSRRTSDVVKVTLGAPHAASSSAASASTASSKPPAATSRQYKLEADRKYESAEYTTALELYTKAITVQPIDKLSNLKFLYGNRSAAYYMAQRYNDCIEDCLEVVRLEPANTKMVSRAARAACTMGDLQRAVDILQNVPKERRSEENETDLTRYKASLETFHHAERCFGTPEGDEQYRMLVAQYSDAVPFRLRSAESLQRQKHYMRAVEVLETLSYAARTPTTCRIMSECLYLSGFEHFERAKKCIADAAQLDDECSALQKKIEEVDEGKQKGNMNFNKKNYGPAAEFYTTAINAAADNEQVLRVLYCNRAAAYKELGRYREGVEDCTKTLNIDKEFFKAYARRARCHEHLGDHFAAVRDYKKAIEYDSSDRELARELRAAEQNLAKEAEREKDYYYQLGVTRTATEREIKIKYRELSLRWHPDKCMGMDEVERERAEHKFKIISEAHATLVDPVKKREYDMKQDRDRFARPGGFGFASTYSGGNTDYFRGRHKAGSNGFW